MFTLEQINQNLVYSPLPVIAGVGLGFIIRAVVGGLISGLAISLIRFFSKPLFIIGLIALLTYYPDTIQWIFVKIGEIELKVFAMFLSVAMPDIFGEVGSEYDSWSSLFNSALSVFPDEILQVCQSLDVAGLMGMITACITTGGTIILMRKTLLRGGVI